MKTIRVHWETRLRGGKQCTPSRCTGMCGLLPYPCGLVLVGFCRDTDWSRCSTATHRPGIIDIGTFHAAQTGMASFQDRTGVNLEVDRVPHAFIRYARTPASRHRTRTYLHKTVRPSQRTVATRNGLRAMRTMTSKTLLLWEVAI